MDLDVWIQTISNGIIMGGIYILMALGLTLILSIMGILQLAHGEIYMLGAYVSYSLCTSLGLNIYLAMFISIIGMAFFGIILERVFFRPTQGQFFPPMVISLGLSLALINIVKVSYGLYGRSLPPLATGIFDIGVPKDRVVAVAFSLAFLLLLSLFLKRNKYGLAMVASAQNKEGALLKGINPNVMSALAMAIGCALACAAGTLAASILGLDPYMGSLPQIKGFAIIVLGGLGSLLGSVFGGLVLGLSDGILPVVLGPAAASVAPLIIVVFLILIKPQGLFGHD